MDALSLRKLAIQTAVFATVCLPFAVITVFHWWFTGRSDSYVYAGHFALAAAGICPAVLFVAFMVERLRPLVTIGFLFAYAIVWLVTAGISVEYMIMMAV
jgi:hypothetical protein